MKLLIQQVNDLIIFNHLTINYFTAKKFNLSIGDNVNILDKDDYHKSIGKFRVTNISYNPLKKNLYAQSNRIKELGDRNTYNNVEIIKI